MNPKNNNLNFDVDNYFSTKEKEILAKLFDSIGFKNLDEYLNSCIDKIHKSITDKGFKNENDLLSDKNFNIILEIGSHTDLPIEKLAGTDMKFVLEVVQKLKRAIILNYMYKKLGCSIEQIEECLNCVDKNLSEIFFVENIDIKELQNITKTNNILDQLSEIDKSNDSFYTLHNSHKLSHIYNRLVDESLIEKTDFFSNIFKSENEYKKHKIIWKGGQTQLVYFTYRMVEKSKASKLFSVPEIALKLFASNKTRHELKNLRSAYSSISHYTSGISLPPNHLSLIDDIVCF